MLLVHCAFGTRWPFYLLLKRVTLKQVGQNNLNSRLTWKKTVNTDFTPVLTNLFYSLVLTQFLSSTSVMLLATAYQHGWVVGQDWDPREAAFHSTSGLSTRIQIQRGCSCILDHKMVPKVLTTYRSSLTLPTKGS